MKFNLRAQITVSCWTEIEANSEEEALEIARNREVGSLSHGAIYPSADECWYFDNDGIPQKIEIDND